MMAYSNKKHVPLSWYVILVMALMFAETCESKCGYEAIFNFGDSNSDTGSFYTAFPALTSPNGMTFFERPTGRVSDGRLIIDFIAQAFGFPYLSPYLQSIGSDYRHGANFASYLSTALSGLSSTVSRVSPFSLDVQLNQMKEFKSKVDQQNFQGNDKLPQADIFKRSLYTFYIGQNDITSNLSTNGVTESVRRSLPRVISRITTTIKEVYKLGGRTFMVQNMAPIGCYPTFLVIFPHMKSDVDEFGCMISYNNLAIEYNNMLRQALKRIRRQLSDVQVIYVDTHAILLDLFRRPTSHGLKYGMTTCCGYGGGTYNFDPRVFCGTTAIIDGETVESRAFSDPYNYVSWDGIHMTEAANKITSQSIISGAYFDPPFLLNNTYSRCGSKVAGTSCKLQRVQKQDVVGCHAQHPTTSYRRTVA